MKIAPEHNGSTALNPPENKLTRGLNEPLEIKKYRLRKATKEFESFFILDMLKAMRKTVPESEMLGGGLGQDIYTGMFDEELARKVAGSSPNSLSEILYKSLEKHLEATEPGESEPGRDKIEIPTSIENTRRVGVDGFARPRIVPPKAAPGGNMAPSPEPLMNEVSKSRPQISADPVLKEFGATIEKASRRYDVDARLIYSVIITESGGRPDAVSAKGAKGLMQLIDSTAAEMGVADSLDPHQNIIGGTKYLSRLLDQYGGDLKLALAAYNAGPGAVSKYNGVPPFRETREYIENVLARLHSAKKP